MPTAKELMHALLSGKTIKDRASLLCTYKLNGRGQLIDEDNEACDIDFDDDDLYIPCDDCHGYHPPNNERPSSGMFQQLESAIDAFKERSERIKEEAERI